MRIMQVMAGAREGGAENIMLESTLALSEAGLEQRIVTRPDNTDRLKRFHNAGITTHTARFNKLWPGPTRNIIKQAIRDFKPDVIQYWMGRAGTFAPAEYQARSIGWYGGYYKRRRFAHCDWHIGLTRDLARHIHEQGIDKTRIGIIHTYADFTDCAPIAKSSLNTPEEAPVALALARLHQKKGLDTLLDATANIPGLYVWIAGTGPIEGELKAQCTALGLNDRVRFLGWRTDRGHLLATCDLVVFPSRYEPFGTVMVDAWAAGKPLVAADAAGPKAYVEHEKNGLLIAKNDSSALARAISRIVDDRLLAEKLIAGGKESYTTRFTKAAFVDSSRAFYDKVRQYAGPFA